MERNSPLAGPARCACDRGRQLPDAPALPKPANDATAVAGRLRDLGFAEVSELRDPGRDTLEAAIKAFGDKSADADWAVVYFAGYGMQADGRNFLIPADARLDSARHMDFETIGLSEVMESVKGAKKLSLVILDASPGTAFLKRMQQTPAVHSFGQELAAADPAPGQLIVFSAKDGTAAVDGEGDHSPFTRALLDHIGENRVDVRSMFSKVSDAVLRLTQNKQQPSVYGVLPKEDLFFKMAEK